VASCLEARAAARPPARPRRDETIEGEEDGFRKPTTPKKVFRSKFKLYLG
jgi:hypothetical protein